MCRLSSAETQQQSQFVWRTEDFYITALLTVIGLSGGETVYACSGWKKDTIDHILISNYVLASVFGFFEAFLSQFAVIAVM